MPGKTVTTATRTLVSKPVFPVSVRQLVEFALRRGDLGGERDFVGPSRALAGIRGHQKLQRSRPADYQKEVALAYEVDSGEFVLRIQGRLDGLRTAPEGLEVEEIKTVQGGWDGVADPLHWAQAKVYGYICARERGLAQIQIRLSYLDLDTAAVTEFVDRFGLEELSLFFEATTAVYLAWVRERHQWCRLRDESSRSLAFPFPTYRPGQREVAVATYRAVANGGRLFLEAPTGIGKTISVLFPAVKALGEGKVERIFYLTARTVGRVVAAKAFADLRAAGLRLRTLTLTAKEKICVQEGQPCDPGTCPLARGYYDRCKSAMREALAQEDLNRSVLEAVGRHHQVCPFELSLDLSVWVDAIVCDYNYVFDPKVYLRRHFSDESGNYAFLVDEAHNLVDRAREMFSADLDGQEIDSVRRMVGKAIPRCAKALTKLSSTLRRLCAQPVPAIEPAGATDPALELNLFPAETAAAANTNGLVSGAGLQIQGLKDRDFLASKEFPAELIPPLDHALRETETWLAANEPAPFRQGLLELYFRLHSFRRTAGLFDERYVTILRAELGRRLQLFCLDPSFLLRQALARGKAAVFFSATLTPMEYYRELLGGSPEDPLLQLPSPFPAEHLAVLVHDQIRTHLRARAATLTDVVQAIAALVQGRRGNYLVYLPSYAYLKAVHDQFRAVHPAVPVLAQRAGMTEMEREAFLAAFAAEHEQTLVGFAVLGGIFGEGIDLVGDRLIGAVVVGVGLPQISIERNLMRDFFQEKIRSASLLENAAAGFGAAAATGFDYAYTFPGMNRVLQATGRVIRSETDRGVVLLIDARFGERRYGRLFTAGWRPTRVRSTDHICEAVASFWRPPPSAVVR